LEIEPSGIRQSNAKKMKKIGKRYLERAQYYRRLAHATCPTLDFSDEALRRCYEWESHGVRCSDPDNGYMTGKSLVNLNVAMWKEDIVRGTLFLFELREDPDIPEWVLKNFGE